MKKYDCSKTLDYFHERERLCKTKPNCFMCELRKEGGSCHVITGFSQKDIDNLQKWSDEHPEKTRGQALCEIFPNQIYHSDEICFKALIGKSCKKERTIENCLYCWSQPYNGEFEKEEK